MDPATRNRLMDKLEAAKEEVSDCEVEIECGIALRHEEELSEATNALLAAEVRVCKIEQQFPECRFWASRHAVTRGA